MKKGSTLLLKLTLLVLALPILILCIYAFPVLFFDVIDEAYNGEALALVLIGFILIMYATAVPYFLALYQTFKLLLNIDKNQAFSSQSVNSLRLIKNYAVIISFLFSIALPFIIVVARSDDTPGFILIGMVIAGASLVIGVFAAILEKLLWEAIQFKRENELTI
ncbi:DUF2975 domain-containing protein [Jeotgalibacillus terrae]|uniref:DUF2975 domain-containing protein n=1 Tax=Jeotgalibacillus terrae TaxID=587735 RepID=A0ABW5ZMS7_9BACL|nr:DUF2975 domain-containing protein [Jeotgalibacillus terrae]MBM7579964.1 heme/copper-type cytochrome/quinol oxidase subunit 4 [Jeotgalibacillus terrae]